jgi:N-ethylmaleimide reductase
MAEYYRQRADVGLILTEGIAPSPVPLSGEMYTDSAGPQPYPQPYPQPITMSEQDIASTIHEYVTASNKREDRYGGSIENRSRFAIEVGKAVVAAIGKDKTGIRLSPYGAFNDMEASANMTELYEYLARELNKLGLVYIHTVDHSSMGAPEVPVAVKETIRQNFSNTIIASGGFDKVTAEQVLQENKADLVAFGKPILANPNFVERIKNEQNLNQPDFATLYTPGEKGYTDYL